MKLVEFVDSRDIDIHDPTRGIAKRQRDDTRRGALTLKTLNHLKKLRALKKLEALKRQDILSAMYGQGGGDAGGGFGGF